MSDTSAVEDRRDGDNLPAQHSEALLRGDDARVAEIQAELDRRAGLGGVAPAAAAAGEPASLPQAPAPTPVETGLSIPSGDGYSAPAVVEDLSPSEVEDVFNLMSAWEGWNGISATALRQRWGSDAGRNLAYADALLTAHPELDQILSDAGLAGNPALLEVGAILGRRLATRGDRAAPASQAAPQPMTGARMPTEIDQQIKEARRLADQAQAEGDWSGADAHYQREQALIARRDGNRSIVGGQQRRV